MRFKDIKIMELPFNVLYVRNENGEIVRDDDKEVTIMDRFANSYPYSFMTFLGKVGCPESALLYIKSKTMPASHLKDTYDKLIKNPGFKSWIRGKQTPKYNISLTTFIAADRILADKDLVREILTNEEFKDLDKVLFKPVIEVRSGVLKTTAHYDKGLTYARAVKKIVRVIQTVWDKFQEEHEGLQPEHITQLTTEDYKKFKNSVKEYLTDELFSKIPEDANILEGVRGAKALTPAEFKEIWLK